MIVNLHCPLFLLVPFLRVFRFLWSVIKCLFLSAYTPLLTARLISHLSSVAILRVAPYHVAMIYLYPYVQYNL